MFAFYLLRFRFRAMTLEAKRVDVRGAQQCRVVSTVRLMASSAALSENRLMWMFLLVLFSLFSMTAEANFDRIRLGESRSLASVWGMAIDAVPLGSGMLNFRGF